MKKANMQEKHYAWTIMVCCILIYFSTSIINVSIGNFVTPVVEEFGILVRQMTIVSGIECAVMAVLYPVAGRILTTYKLKLVVVPALFLMLLGMFLMGSYQSINGFYVSAVMIGIGSAFTQYMAMPLIINMWFKKKTGTVLGICVASGNAFTILFTLLSAQLIEHLGWRSAYHILPLLPVVIALPYVFLHLKSPEEMKCSPYGQEEAGSLSGSPARAGEARLQQSWGVTRKQAVVMPMFYFAWVACLCYSVGSSMPGYIATFATMELGTSVSYGSVAACICSIGSVISGFLLGRLNDRYGVKAGMAWGVGFMTLGMMGMILSKQYPLFLLPACLLTGFAGLNMYSMQAPLIARTVVGDRYYSDIWAVMMIGNSMIAAVFSVPLGAIYDATGSYTIDFLIAIITFAGAMVFGCIALKLSQSYRNRKGA
ncbi:MAG: MFS transporter [Clostridiales bacterium]|nr:MFS transporter [Clostridiales bacterium]